MAVLHPPVELALARAEQRVPALERYPVAYEPKFDGWRGLLFCREGVLQSRQGHDLANRFPELITAAGQAGDVVLDGEVVATRNGCLDFGALAGSLRTRAADGVVAYFVAFDLLAAGRYDHRNRPYQDRRARLEKLMAGVGPPLQLMPSTTDRDTAVAAWMQPHAAAVGIEGVLIKRLDGPYRAGRGRDWVKVRYTVVIEAVVIGVTGDPQRPQELVLARPNTTGELRRIGLSQALPLPLRAQAGEHLTLTGGPPKRISTGIFGTPRWTEYHPVRPTLVVDIRAEGAVLAFTSRLRPQVQRLRPDLTSADVART
jgi:ATP-dependent DNA ligase